MRAYFATTGLIFGLIAMLHVWKGIAEWPHGGFNTVYAIGMAVLVAIPAALSWWAWMLWRKANTGKSG